MHEFISWVYRDENAVSTSSPLGPGLDPILVDDGEDDVGVDRDLADTVLVEEQRHKRLGGWKRTWYIF